MALVNVTNVTVLDNPTHFTNPFQFEITFECLEPLNDDLEWKLIYVGSAYDQQKDQELESILVGPIPLGLNKIVFQTDAPNTELIEGKDILGPTVILLTCSYMEQEFIRIGYYVNNEYDLQELNENPPEVVDVARVIRNILADSPRVTRFDIKWEPDTEMAEDSRDASESMAAGDMDTHPVAMDPAAAAAAADGGAAAQYQMDAAGGNSEMMMA